jgi:hypothetical protein
VTTADLTDPVDPAQRHRARTLGLLVGGGFLALVGTFIAVFSVNGLPKDPKEWKRLQERRAAAEAEEKASRSAKPESPAVKDQPR